MPAGFDLYTNVHKGQRRTMFQISDLAGTMDVGNSGAQQDLLTRLREFREELRLHAYLEETYIHPTLSLRLPGGARRLEDEHVLMHQQLDDILSMAAAAVALDPRLPERRQ